MRTALKSQFTPEQRTACDPKIVAPNTFQYSKNGETVFRLHATDIVRRLPDGSVILNSGGFRTRTTKDRMSCLLPAGYSLYQLGGQWFINGIPYFEGMRVPHDVIAPKKQPKADERMRVSDSKKVFT